eukprot:gene4115-4361_t
MAAHSSKVFQMNGEGAVLDACYTAAGDKVATCSSTGQIQVSEQPRSLAWAPPEHGQVLAIGTQAGVLIVQGPYLAPGSIHGSRSSIGQHHTSREAWCVTDKLACEAGSVREDQGGESDALEQPAASVDVELPAGAGACRCLCWHDTVVGLPPLLVTGHDQGGNIWAYCQQSMSWQEKCSLTAPPGSNAAALQAVHWAPTLGRPQELLAASFGNAAVIYKVLPAAATDNMAADGLGQLAVRVVAQLQHPAAVWKLEFNRLGNTLACSLEDQPAVWLWMPAIDGQWSLSMKLQGGQQAEQLDMD